MLQRISTNAGKVTVATILFSITAIAFVFLFDVQHGGHVQKVTADSATTSVRVLNTPPSWTVHAVESPASTSTSPTNVGSLVTFQATGTDGNGEDYYLLICKDNTAPTPTPSAAPTCNGAGQWTVSTSTTSNTPATATYTASSTDSETEDWYAFICDGNAGTPECNVVSSGDGSADNKSPFSVNHRPTFTFFWDDSPTLPGNMTTWTATSSDTDSDGGADQVQLFVCKANDFTGSACGAGGTWATSTLSASNPTATTTITTPTQDDDYSAYGFIIDNHGLAASGGSQGTDSTLTVANATPSVSNVSVNGGAAISVTVEEGETTGITASFDVTDNNSCVANGSTTYEISFSDINVYRSGVGSSSCQISGDYDPNDCYPGVVPSGTWNVVCTQNNTTCLGPTDDTVTWDCTYPLWFVADPTDGGSQYPGTTWLATALASDDNFATSSLYEADSGVTLNQFLSFDMATTSISYGSFEPSEGNASTSITTDLRSTGNIGLDENLSGEDMCPGYPTCGGNATNTIFALQQHYATSTVAYASGFALATTTQELELNAPKSTSTSSPATTNTYWGIQIPVALTLSGDYIGENTVMGIVGESSDW